MADPRYSWDSNIFLALAGAPVRPELDRDRLAAVVAEIEAGQAVLLTSVLIHVEILRAKTPAEGMAKIEGSLKLRTVFVYDVSRTIAKRAEAIRSACLRHNPVRRVKSVDAIFAATAVLRKAAVLHTTDDGLLALDGHPVVDGLRITLPEPLPPRPAD